MSRTEAAHVGGDRWTRAIGNCVLVSRRRATIRDHVRLSVMFCRSSEIAAYQGPIVRAVAPLISLVVFCYSSLRGWRPDIVAVECHDRLIGGFFLSRFGNFETAVINRLHPLRRDCYEQLVRAVDVILEESPDRRFGYWTVKQSLMDAGAMRGFHRADRERYVVTAVLGPLRCSWLTRRAIRSRRPFVSEPIYYMVKEPSAMDGLTAALPT